MTKLQCLILIFLTCVFLSDTLSSEPLTYTINTKKWSHVLDDHFISLTINPTDLLQGKAFGLGMNSTVAILKGLSPAYIRIGSADTGKYTFKRSRYSNDAGRTEDEIIVTESHWMIVNDVARSAGLDIIVCLNAAHRNGANKKWDTRNSLELISFSDSQGYNLTFQLGYEVQKMTGLTGHQYGKDVNRLRTILNAFPRYQHSKLIGPDIKMLHKKDDVEFINEAISEAGHTLDAVTWHPRWPQPSKMKVSDVSELGYEFPSDYIEWDKSQLQKVLQRSVFKNPIWIGEPKTESTGTFAEGLLWARRLVLAAKLGIEVVMKQPSLMDISHPKPEYWIAFLHKRLLGRSVLETRPMNNQSEVAVITHCTNPLFWAEKSDKSQDGAVTIYGVNMGGKEQRVHMKGTWSGKPQVMLQYLLTSGSDPDSVFSQMTYLNGEPLMMTDDGKIPEILPKIRKVERSVTVKLPPYSVGYWIVPEARVKICQVQPVSSTVANFESLSSSNTLKSSQKSMQNIRNVNQFIVDKLKNPVSDSEEDLYDESSEREGRESLERKSSRAARTIRQVTVEDIGEELKEKIMEIREVLENKGHSPYERSYLQSDTLRTAEERIKSLTDQLGAATRMTNQQKEFDKFLQHSGLNQDFGALMMNGRRGASELKRNTNHIPRTETSYFPHEPTFRRFRRSLSYPEDEFEEESIESYSSEEDQAETRPNRQVGYSKGLSRFPEDSYESSGQSSYSEPSALRSLEDRYKAYISNRIQDGKKKLQEIRRMREKNETEESKNQINKKENSLGNDLQEEILIKEVEVLQKTEEAMANIIKNHKKRQQTIEEILLHEITDIKEDRLSALEDMRLHKEIDDQNNSQHRDQDQQDKEIPKKMRGNVLDVLQRNLNFNLEPNQMAKRSIDKADSNVNELLESSTEEKKPKIVKRSIESSHERSSRKRKSSRSHRGEDLGSLERDDSRTPRTRSERLERMKNFIQSRERIRDRNALRKKSRKGNRKHRFNGSDEDSNEIPSKYHEYHSRPQDAQMNERVTETTQKPERRVIQEHGKQRETQVIRVDVENSKGIRKEDKRNENITNRSTNIDNGSQSSSTYDHNEAPKMRPETEEGRSSRVQESKIQGKSSSQKTKSEDKQEHVPLKIDKNRGLNVLKRISNLVETINNKERSKYRNSQLDFDVDDLSEEFYGDNLSMATKRRPRRSQHNEAGEEESAESGGVPSMLGAVSEEEANAPDMKTLRKEMKIRRLKERLARRRKKLERDDQEEEKNVDEGEKVSKSRLRSKIQTKLSRRLTTESPVSENETMIGETQMTDQEQVTEATQVTDVNAQKKYEGHTTESEQSQEPGNENVQPTESAIHNHGQAESGNEGVSDIQHLMEKEDHVKFPAATPEAGSVDNGEESSDYGPFFQQALDPGTVLVVPEMTEGLILSPIISSSIGDKGFQMQAPVFGMKESENMASEIENAADLIGKTRLDEVTNYDDDRGKLEDSAAVLHETDSKNLIDDLLDPHPFPQFAHESQLINLQMAGSRTSEGNEESNEDNMNYGTKHSLASTSREYLEEQQQLPQDEISLESKLLEDAEYLAADSKARPDITDPSIIRSLPQKTLYADAIQDTLSQSNWDSDIVHDEIRQQEHSKSEDEGSAPLHRARRGILDTRLLTPDDRMLNFKRTMHRRNSPFKQRNELPIAGDKDSFWKVAGSTVKAVFDDVLPDAYGKTRNKIENLGIAEYFKEFGKIVEQMKNLDRIFANIGQAAVKNYIEGSEDEKGDYIQVIAKTKGRSRRDAEHILEADRISSIQVTTEDTTRAEPYVQHEENVPIIENRSTQTSGDPQGNAIILGSNAKEKLSPDMQFDKNQVPMRNGKPWDLPKSVSKPKPNGIKQRTKERPNDLINNIFLMDTNPGIVEVTKSAVATTEPTQTLQLQPFQSRYAKPPSLNLHSNRLFQRDTSDQPFPTESSSAFMDKLMNQQDMNLPQLQKFSPWMKTTKDFINQALTTLQRQRELSEMIARESVNDLVKREIEKKVIGKREILQDTGMTPFFPVYQVPPTRKRETYSNLNENTSRYLTQLQPGVYIVPTDDMKNLRSEQIVKEATGTKPGSPSVVTLNIYYDKKNAPEWELPNDEEDEHIPGNLNYVRYPSPISSWNRVPNSNYPAAEYVPSTAHRYLPALQEYHPDAKFQAPLDSHYPDWISATSRSYSAVPRNQPLEYERHHYNNADHYPQHKSTWSDFKSRQPTTLEGTSFGSTANNDSGWAVQFQPSKKKAPKSRLPLKSADRQARLYADKKRSVTGAKETDFTKMALPFWKYFIARGEAKNSREKVRNVNRAADSLEDVFEENRKRARQNEKKETEEKPESTETEHPEMINADADEESSNNSRRRRDAVHFEPNARLHDQTSKEDSPAEITSLRESHKEALPDEASELIRSRRGIDENNNVPLDGDQATKSPLKPILKDVHDKDSSLEVPGVEKGEDVRRTNGTTNEHVADESNITSFFKYAYNSLIEMMRGMTGLV